MSLVSCEKLDYELPDRQDAQRAVADSVRNDSMASVEVNFDDVGWAGTKYIGFKFGEEDMVKEESVKGGEE